MRITLTPILALFFLAACKKDGTQPSQNKMVSQFVITSECGGVLSDSVAFLDSFLLFKNSSYLQDTIGFNKPADTYKWDFGDQTESTEKNAEHTYTKTGIYTVKLYTYLNNEISDSSVRRLRIIIGSREFKISDHTIAVDMDELNDNDAGGKGVIALFLEENSSLNFSYGILRADSLLNLKWIHKIAGDANNTRLNSLKRITSNQYILSGNYLSGNTNQFCLSKINSSGSLIWNKYIDNLPGKNTFTIPVSAGGFLTVGDSDSSGNLSAVIVKCNNNGDEIWRKRFDNTPVLFGVNNIIETGSGYVFASLGSGLSVRIVLTELDYNGNIVRQTEIDPLSPVTTGKAGVIYNGNTFFVYATNTGFGGYAYFFNNGFSYIRSKQIPVEPIRGGFVNGNSFDIYTSGNQDSEIEQHSEDGSLEWDYLINNTIHLSCSTELVGASRYCKKVIYTSDEIIALSDGRNIDQKTSLYIEKLTPEGILK
jgi:PKD repeat protein